MATETIQATDHKLYVAGDWIDTGEWSEVNAPYDGTLIGRVPKGDASLVDKAKDVASSAGHLAGNVASTIGHKAEDATHAVGSGIQSLGSTLREHAPEGGMLGSAASEILARVDFGTAREIASLVTDLYAKEEIDSVYIVFSEFKTVMTPNLVVTKLLPVEAVHADEESVAESANSQVDYIYEQPVEQLLGKLLPRYIETQILRAMLESSAAEHAARMTAMESATKNAGDVIEALTLHMNKVRHAAIRHLPAAHLHEQLRDQRALYNEPREFFHLGHVVAVIVNTMTVEADRRETKEQRGIGLDDLLPFGFSGDGGSSFWRCVCPGFAEHAHIAFFDDAETAFAG